MAWKRQDTAPPSCPALLTDLCDSGAAAAAAAACSMHMHPKASPDLTDAELQRLFDALDVDNTGSVDSQEFFAGVLQAALLPHQTHTVLEASFKLLDRCCGVEGLLRLLLLSCVRLTVMTTTQGTPYYTLQLSRFRDTAGHECGCSQKHAHVQSAPAH